MNTDNNNKNNTLQILLIDDHQLFADGLVSILERAYPALVISHVTSIDDGQAYLSETSSTNLVLVDINLPELVDFQRIIQLKREFIQAKFILLSDTESKDLVVQAISAGLDGYIPKSTGKDLFLGALNLVISGGVYIPKVAVTGETTNIKQPSKAANTKQEHINEKQKSEIVLTNRQLEILKLLEDGLPNKSIARALDISDGTVRIHISTIYRVLNVQNRVQAVLKSKELGYF